MIEDCLSTYNRVIYIWGGFQNITLKDILLLYIFWKEQSTLYFAEGRYQACSYWSQPWAKQCNVYNYNITSVWTNYIPTERNITLLVLIIH